MALVASVSCDASSGAVIIAPPVAGGPTPPTGPSPLMLALYGTVASYWVPRAGDVGFVETVYLKSRSPVGGSVPVGSRPPEELQKNYSLPDGQRISLDHDVFKESRARHLVSAAAMGNRAVTGAQLKAGMHHHLPKLVQTEYLILRYRDYSDFAVKTLSTQGRPVRDGTIGFGRKYVVRGVALRTGHDVGTLVPLTEMQFIHAAELTHITSYEGGAAEAGRVLGFLTEDQFKAALSAADSVKVAVDTPEALDDAPAPTPSWNPMTWRAALDAAIQHRYRTLGRTVTRVAVAAGCVLAIYVSIKGVGALRSLRGPPPPPPRAPRPRLLTMMEELFTTGDLRVAFDYLLTPAKR